jgi:hypothetical protein
MKKKAKKSKNWRKIRRSLGKIAASFLVVAFFASLLRMGGTNAGFLDEEKSEGNLFSVTTLDSSVSSAGDFSPKISPSMETLRAVSIAKDGLSDFKYRVSAENFSGDAGLCGKLEIKDDLDDTFRNLNTYISSDTDNSTKTGWNFTAKLTDNDDALADKTCSFDLKFEAWQEDFAYGAGGFSDTEIISSSIQSEHWTNIADHLVVNEVYYDVDGSHGTETANQNEWVELYNPTSSAVNLKDWKLCDNYGCSTLSTSDLDIPANGYAVVTKEASTWGFWTVPGSAVKIVLGTAIGNSGLRNDGDRVILKNNSGSQIDAMSYGDDTFGLSPACAGVSPGHSLARHPAGQDTGVREDFEDLSSPNPGTNPHTVVMNEIMPNPAGNDDAAMPGGEWVELYNYGEYDIELKDWKLEDGDGNVLKIKDSNTSGGTVISGGEKMVVYRDGDKDFDLGDDGDTVSLIDEKGLIKDSYKFGKTPEGKSIARFPDAVGPWVDPESTPGEENKMTETEMDNQILEAYDKCFDKNDKLNKDEYKPICQPEYLQYIGLLKKLDDKKADLETLEKAKKRLAEEEKKENIDNADENLIEGVVSENTAIQDDTTKIATEEDVSLKLITKELNISLTGKLDVPDGFEADAEQKMKKIELSGEESVINGLKDFEIDLAKVKIEKVGEIKITVSDLDFPDGIGPLSAKKDDVVAVITVAEKPKDDPKKDEIKKVDAALPKTDILKTDEKKDDSKNSSSGDGSGGGGPAPKSVDSATP